MDFGDFARQVPIGILLAPFVFGFLYIVLMVYIFQRARKRRRAKQEAALAAAQGSQPEESGAASWQIPPELRDLPEPDFDSMLIPVSTPASTENVRVVPEKPATAPQPAPKASAAASKQESRSVATPNQEIEPVMSAPSASSASYDPSAPLPEDAVEVMRIYRDLTDGRIIVQINNNNYRALGDIKSPDLSRRFTAVVRELWAMINPGGVPQAQTGSYPATAAPAAPESAKSKMGLLNASDEEKQKPNIMRQFARAAMGQSNVQDSAPAGIAGAVEEFLQFKLSNTPELSMRSIHIRPSPDHGIRIEVDGRFYDGIGDVTEPEVREFLQNMMREWEARQ